MQDLSTLAALIDAEYDAGKMGGILTDSDFDALFATVDTDRHLIESLAQFDTDDIAITLDRMDNGRREHIASDWPYVRPDDDTLRFIMVYIALCRAGGEEFALHTDAQG